MKVRALLVAIALSCLPVATQSLLAQAKQTTFTVSDPNVVAVYNTPADWPLPKSLQCHWGRATLAPAAPILSPAVFDPLRVGVGHTHIEVHFPYDAEISGPFDFDFTVVLFHSDATITNVRGIYVRNIVWDDTGSSTPPNMTGTADQVQTWHAKATFDPFMTGPGATDGDGSFVMPQHGFFSLRMTSQTHYANGHEMDNWTAEPLYSVIDPSAPPAPESQYSRETGVLCEPHNDFDHAGREAWGFSASEVRELLPNGPISEPWSLAATRMFGGITGYTYANQGFFTAPLHEQLRMDPNFHGGVTGTLLQDVVFAPNGAANVVFLNDATIDPRGLTIGVHKWMALWSAQTDKDDLAAFQADDTTVALVTVPFTVGTVTPPTTCQDPTATNVGGPLPCVFPPPQSGLLQCFGQMGFTIPGTSPITLSTGSAINGATITSGGAQCSPK
jgi:hypothetical protein